jgi:hypothetical protein
MSSLHGINSFKVMNTFEILPHLYLGPIESSQDFEFIKSKNINVIFNCSKEIDNKFGLNLLKPLEEAPIDVQKWLYDNSYYIKYYRIAVDDNGNKDEIMLFYKYIHEYINIINNHYNKGDTILVHCLAGNQRSASFICAFLMYSKKYSLDEAIKFLLEKKPNVFFFGSKINFIDALKKYENDIK